MPSHPPTSTPVLRGASNFRDLGNHSGLDGRRVRSGQVFRSDHLASLTAEDHQALQPLGITHSIDFRGQAERATLPYALPYALPGTTVVPLAIEPTAVIRVQALLARNRVPTETETVNLMCRTYRGFARDAAPTYAHFFRHLLAHPTPLVFHCTAGKDRTGFAAALLLGALGVSREAVMADYLLANQLYRRSPQAEVHGPAHVMDVLWRVRPAFLQAAFDTIDTDFGGMPRYLGGPMGLGPNDLDRLRDRLLEE